MIEIEKKFLIARPPFSWEKIQALIDSIRKKIKIEQTYLDLQKSSTSIDRVRKTVNTESLEQQYIFNSKKFIETGMHEEFEQYLSEQEYLDLLKYKKRNTYTIYKRRLLFNYLNQMFELDIFEKNLKGLVILELEIKDKNQSVIFPPFLEIEREIIDGKYNNVNLSYIKTYIKACEFR